MGLDYALVHLFYTLPPALVLTLLYRPLFTRLDAYKICFLITIAVVSTTPWDSYLIRTRVWTYPPNAVLGPKLFDIPLEEVFFFVIQTYNTSLLYLILNKPTFHPAYLVAEKSSSSARALPYQKWLGLLLFTAMTVAGWFMFTSGGPTTYMGLIWLWSTPFMLFLWSLAYQFLIRLPWSNVLVPIVVPTIYLWIVDALALQRGTWVIESGTKVGWYIMIGSALEVEEAYFFFATNVLIVFGQVAFDNALAVLYAFPDKFPHVPALPSPAFLVRALLYPTASYDSERITGLQEAVERLRKKSRSFFLASGTFQGRLRVDLILLYSFCRIADDLVDNATSVAEAQAYIDRLRRFLDLCYEQPQDHEAISDFVRSTFPLDTHMGLLQLPTERLRSEPLYGLLEGFEMDVQFSGANGGATGHPIKTEKDLSLYAARVAGTVAELLLQLALHHAPAEHGATDQDGIMHAGGQMGIALQYVNICRDISVDAALGRVYLPLAWLKAEGLSVKEVLEQPTSQAVTQLRAKLLTKAFAIYQDAVPAIDELPTESRGPVRVAVESYMEIGRVLREPGYTVTTGRATVPVLRRIKVAWKALQL